MHEWSLARRRIVIVCLGAVYALVSAPLAEVGGGILGGGCNEPDDVHDEACQAIYPEGVDAWQVIPVVVVVLLVAGAIYRASFRLVHAALAVCLMLTILLPLLISDLLL